MRRPLLLGLLLLLPACRKPAPAAATPPADPIPAHESFTLASAGLGETRTVNVFLPPEYATDSTRAFPVLYMPDGGLDEDFPHVVNTLDSLARLGEVPPTVVVGVPNTERRRDLTPPTTVAKDSAIAPRVGGAAAFRGFLRDELVPEVTRRYRVTGDRAIVGESLAGLFIVETVLREPALFPRAIAVDPSLWWNHESLLHDAAGLLARPAGTARRLYVTGANAEGNGTTTAQLADTLRAAAPAELAWTYVPRPDLTHPTIFRATLPGALVWLLGSH